MHIQTHILSGWCVANCFPCNKRQRLFAMIAASAADIDGITILFGQKVYWDYHHTFGHNVFTALLLSAVFAAFIPRRRIASFLLFLALFHLHLLMDYFGSGKGWCIPYLWPMKGLIFRNQNAWEFYSWQNLSAFVVLLICTIGIAIWKRRTPIELILPRVEGEIVQWLGRTFGEREFPAGHCVQCGYDLRATPDRCPECGRIPTPRQI